MDQDKASDAFELFRPCDEDVLTPSSKAQWNVSKYFLAVRSWYQRSILLSGKHYVELDELDRRGHVKVSEMKDRSKTGIRTGWKFTSPLSCILVGLCLCFNTIFIIVAAKKHPPNHDGLGDIDIKGCNTASSSTRNIHVVINVLASALLAASNFNMQCLTAPTRSDVDRLHEQGAWLDIGIPSVRNLCSLPIWRTVLWVALLFSSVPLHLLWNSAIFETTSTSTEYTVLVVSEDFHVIGATSEALDCSNMLQYGDWSIYENIEICSMMQQLQGGEFSPLDPAACIALYAQKLVPGRSSVIAVAKQPNVLQSKMLQPANASYPVLVYFGADMYSNALSTYCKESCSDWCKSNCTTEYETIYCKSNQDVYGNPYVHSATCYDYVNNGTAWDLSAEGGTSDWLCEPDEVFKDGCSLPVALRGSDDWTVLPDGYEISRCLTRPGGTMCKLQYSATILYLVICCNTVKLLAIAANLYLNEDVLMASTGDAVSSFLQRPDSNSRGRCLLTTNTSYSSFYGSSLHWKDNTRDELHPFKWGRPSNYIERWHQATTWKHIGLCVFLWLAFLIASIYYLVQGIIWLGPESISGGFKPKYIFWEVSHAKRGSNASIITTSILINLPQLVLSGLYFAYNAIYTCMASAYEWSQYGRTRKGLRVTNRCGRQRSSYWLQLPWKLSLPLFMASALLHWLVSQSAFLINLSNVSPAFGYADDDGSYPTSIAGYESVTTAIGLSTQAVIGAIAVGLAMLIALLVVSRLRLRPGMPLVGSNSFAISAACHPPKVDNGAAFKPVMWGAVSHQTDNSPGHCCFTSYEVESPRLGEFYAGLQDGASIAIPT